MDGAGHDGVAVHPEQGLVLGHVPHKQLAVGQPVLGDDPGHHGVRHLHVTQTPASLLQSGQAGRLYDDQPQVRMCSFRQVFEIEELKLVEAMKLFGHKLCHLSN